MEVRGLGFRYLGIARLWMLRGVGGVLAAAAAGVVGWCLSPHDVHWKLAWELVRRGFLCLRKMPLRVAACCSPSPSKSDCAAWNSCRFLCLDSVVLEKDVFTTLIASNMDL